MGVSVFPSGGYPPACRYGHLWGPGTILIGWTDCDCPQAMASPGGQGHHWVKCAHPAHPECPSLWYDPPHDSGGQ